MIEDIYVERVAYIYLQQRQILSQFKKAVKKIKSNQLTGLDFKKRKPKSANIWSFRISQKYRAFCRKKGSQLTVFKSMITSSFKSNQHYFNLYSFNI